MIGLAIVSVVSACGAAIPHLAATQEPTSVPRPTAPTQHTVTYCSPGGVSETMDVYTPANLDGPAPAVVYVHGGAWQHGNSKFDGSDLVALQASSALLENGFVFVSINYRLAPEFQWPAQIIDSKCAIRYLRAHARSLHVDPQRIGAMGSSAGGQLAALLGTTGQHSPFDVGEYLDQSSAVNATVDMYGPTDLTTAGWGQFAQQVFTDVFHNDRSLLADASAVTHVSPAASPFLIIQGSADTVVPPVQSEELYSRLRAARVHSDLLLVDNAQHGLFPDGAPISPSLDQITHDVVNFYASAMKR